MKRLLLLAIAALLVAWIGGVACTALGLPPIGMLWRHGFEGRPAPTGRVLSTSGVEFVEIGPGCFRMGSDRGAEGGDLLGRWCARLGLPWGDQERRKPTDEMPVHWVEFPRGFWIARTELTNEQFGAFRPLHEPSECSPEDRCPVVSVSWEEAGEFCAWLTEQSGLDIGLPSQAAWECACRAGSRNEYCFGDDEKLLRKYAWYDANSSGQAHEVGTRRANAFGLLDLHGNVWEWCEDSYHPSYEGAPSDGTAWTEGGAKWEDGTPIRVVRGGSWFYRAVFCRSAYRDGYVPWHRFSSLGFRPALSIRAE